MLYKNTLKICIVLPNLTTKNLHHMIAADEYTNMNTIYIANFKGIFTDKTIGSYSFVV